MGHPALLSCRRMTRTTALAVLSIAALALPATAGIVVRDWQFNTPGDNEGWTADAYQVYNLHVAAAVSGPETVLTCEHLQNQADPKLHWPDEVVPMPAEAISWESLTFRIRQIGVDGVTPAPFDSGGTITMLGAGSIPTLNPIPTASGGTVTVVPQADEWLLIVYDLTAWSGDISPMVRMDPIAGTDIGGGVIQGNFEIDFVTLTAAVETTVTADAGPDQDVTDEDDSGDEPVTLDGSGSSDSDGTIVSYQWTESAVPIATGVSPVVTLTVGGHLIELTVTDDSAETDTDSVAAIVHPYVPPKVYYLDAVNGDDTTGDGSAGAPWQNLAKVQTVLAGRDSVILASGNYGAFEMIATASGGWDLYDDWVTYRAADGADVEFESVRIAYTGSSPPDPTQEGFFDAYIRIEDVHILDGVVCNSARHWALVDCLIERYGPWTGSVDDIEKTALSFRCGTDILLEDSEITNTGTAIAGRGHDVRILNNYIHDGKHDGIRVTGFWDSLIEGNTICRFDDGVTDAEASWSRHCDLIHIFIPGPGPDGWQNHNVTFRNNILYDTEAQVVQFNNYYASPVHNEQILFENNIFGPAHANMFNNADPVDGLIFRNNTVIVFDEPRQFNRWTLENYTLRISRLSTGVQVYNNILGAGAPEAGAEVEIFDYNLYQITPNIMPSGVDESRAFGRFTLVGVDPMFVNPGAFDGVLEPASPAINYGTRLLAPTPIWEFDIVDTPRDNRPDLGAWELPGQPPPVEPVPVVYNDDKTIFVDDFDDGHYIDVDPWLQGPHQQGMSWRRPDPVDFKYIVTTSAHFADSNAVVDPLGDDVDPRLAWLFSDQGDDWVDYDLTFDAANSYLVLGSGVMVLALDRDNYYWLDISRDNGRLMRYIGGVEVELARDADIELPHVGPQAYKVSVRHEAGGEVTISVDTHNDGSEDFSYTDADAAAIAVFGSGGVGFHTDVVDVYHRVHYDNVRVDVLATTGKPGDANGDGDVDLDDFVILKQSWGQNPLVDDRADFNNDGDVDLDDFVILKQNWGT